MSLHECIVQLLLILVPLGVLSLVNARERR